ncbi:hypothetical protein ACLRDC_19505 [Gluconacetobacter sacchari]|uniref:hypothetical protein n=1 Tax=Gluconacetobacter sacchari TaxID=92759 RepID=UPI0039B69432
MSNCAINWFRIDGPAECLRAVAHWLTLPPPADGQGMMTFDLPGMYDQSAWNVAEELAAREQGVCIRYEYRPEYCNFMLTAVGAWQDGRELYRAVLQEDAMICYGGCDHEGQGCLGCLNLVERTDTNQRAAAHFPLRRHFDGIRDLPCASTGWRMLIDNPPYQYAALRLAASGETADVLDIAPGEGRARLFGQVDTFGLFGEHRPLGRADLLQLHGDLPPHVLAAWETFAGCPFPD